MGSRQAHLGIGGIWVQMALSLGASCRHLCSVCPPPDTPSHCVSQYLRFLIMLPAGGVGGAGVAEVRVREEPDRMRVWECGEVERGRW